MSNSISRTYSFANGGVGDGGQVDAEVQNIVNTINNADAGITTWTNVKATTLTGTACTLTTATVTTLTHGVMAYRRPVLQFSSTTVVNMETGIDGTSGEAKILFPDGSLRTDSTASRINLTISQAAAFSGSAQSGMDTGSVSNNTWYAQYAAKVTDSTTNFVATTSLLLPLQSNFTTLNSRLGTNGWVYLGLIRYGDNSTVANAILNFVQAGNHTKFLNNCSALNSMTGIALATASATSTSWAYASGTGAAQIPSNITIAYFWGNGNGAAANATSLLDSGTNRTYDRRDNTVSTYSCYVIMAPSEGIKISNSGGGAVTQYVGIGGFWDGALGIGANPLL